MHNLNHEKISALMDGETRARKECDGVIENLLNDRDLQRVWYEYHLIRDCLRHDQTRLGHDLAPSFRQRLQREGKLSLNRRLYLPANQAFKGFAIAASVAAVAVGVWQIMPQESAPASLSVMSQTATQEQTAAMFIHDAAPILTAPYADESAVTVRLDDPYLQAHQRAMTTDGLMQVSASFDGVQ
ncbi:MAG: sigma-E factor negative regulatory protein [Neisseria sp.]|nr:sigma-E factor negative regulatory protein [Neisseria sp.]